MNTSHIPGEAMEDAREPTTARTVVQVVVGTAALACAVIHASMIGSDRLPSVDGRIFLVAALAGAASGAAVLWRATIDTLSIAVAVHAVLLAAWVLSRTAGLPLDGLRSAQPVGLADTIAAVLSAAVVVGGAWLIVDRSPRTAWRVAHAVPTFAVMAVVAATVPALASVSDRDPTIVAAGTKATAVTSTTVTEAAHVHDDTDGHEGTEGHGGTDGHQHTGVAKPFDPTQPVDLSGTPGVTQVQQKEAELLLAQTLVALPQFADPAVAESRGYHSIGDALTGDEHYMNWAAIDDQHVLDPNVPESLVYNTRGGKKQLEAAMFILPTGYTLDNTPAIGGSLIQWHIHDDLCFTEGDRPSVAGFHSPGQPCPPGLQAFTPAPMIHVWITKNPCGPFSALEGIGAGQVKAGETRSCDHAHGSTNSTF